MSSNGFQWVPMGSSGFQGVTRGYKRLQGLQGVKRVYKGVKRVVSKGFQRLLPWYKRVQRGNLKGGPRVSERVPNGSKVGSRGSPKSQEKSSN